ncbi:hypothetical protein ASG87_11565 [Frateuria sp. Soil773]|uniref:DUF3613 domain-containing protein n=1 Tax=Frateuria sp. Soil773 TaxID=1736407 RepID=UPI0006F99BE0|nr:DUF3613 domain-containing protein [Frateuria sp. Soil773]KRF02113.1 hypothetical protein ASG87_11565 [Frateuria sp. Soil773]
MILRFASARSSVLLALLALPALSMAQQQPLTGQMMAGYPPADTAPAQPPPNVAPATAPRTVPAPRPARVASQRPPLPPPAQPMPAAPMPTNSMDAPEPEDTGMPVSLQDTRIGETTRQLLQMQADDRRAGTRLPVLGDEASASYRRYLKSFDHAIPEFYETNVGKSTGNGR